MYGYRVQSEMKPMNLLVLVILIGVNGLIVEYSVNKNFLAMIFL
jgi:hypothetical protein